MEIEKFCILCNASQVPLMKYGAAGKNRQTPRFLCRKCNSTKAKAYYETEKGRRAAKERRQRMYIKYPEKAKARMKLFYALETGKKVKPSECESCKLSIPSRILQGHHHDYSKPLDVQWLCPPCHSEKEKRSAESK